MIGGYVITFHTHYEALVCMRSLEKSEALQNGVITVKLIPVPRELSSACAQTQEHTKRASQEHQRTDHYEKA